MYINKALLILFYYRTQVWIIKFCYSKISSFYFIHVTRVFTLYVKLNTLILICLKVPEGLSIFTVIGFQIQHFSNVTTAALTNATRIGICFVK